MFLVGWRIEPPVSSAIAQVTRLAATDVPDPLLDVPAERSVSYGLQLMPPNGLREMPEPTFALARMMAPASRMRVMNVGIARRPIVGVRGVGTGRGAHVERVVPVLDREGDAVQRPDQLAGRLEVRVLLRGDFECVGHRRVVVGRVGQAAGLARVEPVSCARAAGRRLTVISELICPACLIVVNDPRMPSGCATQGPS